MEDKARRRGHDENQASGLAEHGQPGGVAFVRATEARRVDDLQRRPGDLLRVVDFAKLLDPRLGDRGHGALSQMSLPRIGLHAGKPLEQRALAGTLVAYETDLHGVFLGGIFGFQISDFRFRIWDWGSGSGTGDSGFPNLKSEI